VQTTTSGYVSSIDAEKVAKVAFALGAGRAKAGDAIDPLAGVTLAVKRGDRVPVGAPLATLETTREPELLERLAADILKAFSITPERPEPRRWIAAEID
jgi:thymidine phosphorylase